MLNKLFWFGLGFFTARYLILKNGVEGWKQIESGLMEKGQSVKEEFEETYY